MTWRPSSKTTKQTNPKTTSTMLVSLTVGKVDAGVAVLLTEDKRLVRLHRRATRLQQAIPRLTCPILTTAPDRIPLHSPPSRHLLRQHRRHHSSPKLQIRKRSRAKVPRAPNNHLPHLRTTHTVSPHHPLPERYTDIRGSRMGSY